MRSRTAWVIVAMLAVGATACNTADKHACQKDSDCVLNCKHGAVSSAWAEGRRKECDDGCSDRKQGPPRCEQKVCTAYFDDGRPNPSCTRR